MDWLLEFARRPMLRVDDRGAVDGSMRDNVPALAILSLEATSQCDEEFWRQMANVR